ncbi:single-stranded DNA-binding protein [Sulfurimonas sp. HSL3-7]|uniref:single-stranded DNA-binding protein n=1 Tax=Sulfonitrofixus jiaomeiensis TaxID=3131938 RepID=UPI0031F84B8C
MYNKVVLVGNLTRDIELRYSQAGMAIAKTAIATSRKFTSNGEKKEEVMFIDITFFGRSAEVANQYLRKGSKILVEGRLQFEQWVDQNGGKRSKHSVAVETMQMLDSKGEGQQANAQGGYNAPQQAQGGYGQPQQQTQSSSYNAPQQQQYQQPSYGQPAQQQAPKQNMPADLPSIDIDEDEIPF